MYLLYVDESGSTSDPSQPYFVLSGISVFERKTHWIEQEMNKIAIQFSADSPYDYELHGSPMRTGKSEWKTFPFETRMRALKSCLSLVADKRNDIFIFAAVIEQGYSSGKNTITECFEQIASRFDMYLSRKHQQGDTQRGVAIFDKSSTEKSIQSLARTFKYSGHSYGKLRNFSEVPLFLDSKSSRLIQLADIVSYSIYRKFAAGDNSLYDLIQHRFDNNNGQIHGLFIKHKPDSTSL